MLLLYFSYTGKVKQEFLLSKGRHKMKTESYKPRAYQSAYHTGGSQLFFHFIVGLAVETIVEHENC